MAINVDITRTNSESNMTLLKKFSRKVQESGVVPRAKSIRYAERKPSKYKMKKNKIELLKRKEDFNKLLKLGKVSMPTRGRR